MTARIGGQIRTLSTPQHLSLQSYLPAVKDSIQRIAIETLVWYGDWKYETINSKIRISKFKNLKELVLVERLPDFTGCGCCHEFDGPEEGLVGFREQVLNEKWVNDCKREFTRIKESDPTWKEPEVRFVDLLRDGVLIDFPNGIKSTVLISYIMFP
jgi:hypothetical protein